MKKMFSGLAAGSFALLSCSVLAHANEAAMAEAAHNSMHISDAIMPVALMIAISIIARPFFKKMRQARIDREESQGK